MANCPFLSTSGDLVDCLEEDCQLWNIDENECSIKILSDVNIHFHKSHWHQLSHSCIAGLYTSCGADQGVASALPKATILIQEYMSNEDMDGNDSIYGFDFMISDDDEEKPPILKGIENSPDWSPPSCSITWAEYLLWIGGGDSPCEE